MNEGRGMPQKKVFFFNGSAIRGEGKGVTIKGSDCSKGGGLKP